MWESGKVGKLGEFYCEFPVKSILSTFYNLIFFKTSYCSGCRCTRTPEALHELFRVKLLRQLPEALVVAGGAAALHKLLVLVGEVVKGHLAEEELLAAILDVHRQAAEPLVRLVHRQRPGTLPLLPVAHQDEGQRNAYPIIGYALKQRPVGLVAVKLRYLHPCRLPVVGLVVQRLYRDLALHPVQAVGPKLPKPTPSKREQADNLLVLINLT